MSNRYTIQFSTHLENLPLVREFLESQLGSHVSDELWVNRVTLAMEEAITNSILHAHKNQGNAEIRIEIVFVDKKVEIYLYDPAPPFDYSQYKASGHLLRTDTNRPGGLGITLIQKIMDKVEIDRREDKSVYYFQKYLPHL
ncbi:MAG: ATP-binding protein [Bacteroidia bacterium]